MVNVSLNEESIFNVACRIPADDARTEYLDQICGDDGDLRRRVQRLLDVYFQQPTFLENSHTELGLTCDVGAPERVGSTLGPYKIVEKIAEGGMGVVYVAEQREPVRRKVALKVIRPGMAGKNVVARFEAERQALAMMNHPNIARVFDGGATDEQLPYFVMELVQGLPITDYCDQQRMNIRERLELFLDVCHAVQHAHQKGIIHRDLKPSNVLVAEIDDKAVAKVIDFGVAKAIHQPLTERSIHTQFSQMIGTPLYMSPEQAGLGVIDVDTRSDVYSLGVMLYEMLTGDTPFSRQALETATFDEMRRIIREQEPRRPSAMISTMEAKAQTDDRGTTGYRFTEAAGFVTRRTRLAGDEGLGKGSGSEIRICQCSGIGHSAIPEQRTDGGGTTVNRLPGQEICSAQSRSAAGWFTCSHGAADRIADGFAMEMEAISNTTASYGRRRTISNRRGIRVYDRRFGACRSQGGRSSEPYCIFVGASPGIKRSNRRDGNQDS